MLSHDELRLFERQGFIGPYQLDPAELTEYRDGFLRHLLPQWEASTDLYRKRNQHLYSKSLLKMVTSPRILERVKSILGPDVLLWVGHVVQRATGSGGQGWHSDSINQYVRGVHLSLALTPMRRDNGCMKVLAGSHLYRTSLVATQKAGLVEPSDDAGWERLADQIAPWHAPHRMQYIEVDPGEFFFTWGGLWHGIGTNETDQPRVACVARFARPDVTCKAYGFSDCVIEEGPKLPCLLVSGEDRFKLNDLHAPPTTDIVEA